MECMGHSLIYRNGKFVDVRGEMNTMEEVLSEFDFGDDDMLEFDTLEEFKNYLDDMGIPYYVSENLIKDDNGNPLTFYHSYDEDNDSDMYWLSTNYEFSKEFGDKTIECYIKSENPKVFKDGILRYEDGSPVMFDDEPATIGYLDAVEDEYIEYLMDNYDCIMDDNGEFTVVFSRDNIVTDMK